MVIHLTVDSDMVVKLKADTQTPELALLTIEERPPLSVE
jgi:hypothetical protein